MTDPSDKIITVSLTQQQTWIIEQAILIERRRAREDGRQAVVDLCNEISERMFWAKMQAARQDQQSPDSDGGDA